MRKAGVQRGRPGSHAGKYGLIIYWCVDIRLGPSRLVELKFWLVNPGNHSSIAGRSVTVKAEKSLANTLAVVPRAWFKHLPDFNYLIN